MNLEPSPEQQELRATLRRWAAGEGAAAEQVRPLLDGASWKPDGAWTSLVGMGLTEPLELVDAVVVAEELGRVLYPGPWAATAAAAAVVGGLDVPAALAATRAGGGDVAVEGQRLTGTLHGVLGAPHAEVLVVDVGATVAVVERADADVEPEAGIDPTTAAGTVRLDRAPFRAVEPAVPVDPDHLLVLRAAEALGAAGAVLDVAVEHAKVRHQFGQPIGAFQAVAHLLVDALESVELARGGVLHAAWATGDERRAAVQRLLGFGDRLATVADTAIQVLGGIGYTWEHDAHLHLRRLLAWSTACGPASSHRIALGRALLEREP